MGDLVRDATRHFSTLIRSEVELAKSELAAEVRKGVKGSVMFVVALAILVFSLFFLFIAVGELLAVWMPRWAAFGIVFVLMVLTAAGFALFGWRRVRSIQKPDRTIRSVRDTGAALAHRRDGQQPEPLPDPEHGPDVQLPDVPREAPEASRRTPAEITGVPRRPQPGPPGVPRRPPE